MKRILRKYFYNVYFYLSIFIQRIKKNTTYNFFKNKHNLKNISDLNVLDYKKSDTVFILGSGSSINRMSKNMWSNINQNDSIGINSWIIHDHISTFYLFEMSRYNDIAEKYIGLLKKRKDDLSNRPFIFKNMKKNVFDKLEFPKNIKANLYFANDYEIPIGDVLNLDKAFSKLSNQITVFQDKEDESKFVTWKSRATISMAILFAYQLGYKNIVLCGIDLSNSSYFYEENRSYYESIGRFIGQTGQYNGIHKTIDPAYSNVTIDKVIYKINDYILRKNNVKLYIQNKSSALYPKIDLYVEKK